MSQIGTERLEKHKSVYMITTTTIATVTTETTKTIAKSMFKKSIVIKFRYLYTNKDNYRYMHTF